MPRFFFDVYNEYKGVCDSEGVDLPDFDTAQQEAIQALKDLAREQQVIIGRREATIDVRDEHGHVRYTASYFFTSRYID